MKTGETFTIAGVHKMVPNLDRKWWQFWKPRLVTSGMVVFRVI